MRAFTSDPVHGLECCEMLVAPCLWVEIFAKALSLLLEVGTKLDGQPKAVNRWIECNAQIGFL